MSRENVEIARRANEAFNRGRLERALGCFAPDAEMRDLANAPDQAGVVKGTDAIRDAWSLWTAAFDEFRADVAEWTDMGDFVIAAAHWQGRGTGSGVSIELRQFDLYE